MSEAKDQKLDNRWQTMKERELQVVEIARRNSVLWFKVAAKNPDTEHSVSYNLQQRVMACDCEDCKFKGPSCIHILRSAIFLMDCKYATRSIYWNREFLEHKGNTLAEGIKYHIYQFSPELFGLAWGEPPAIPEEQWNKIFKEETFQPVPPKSTRPQESSPKVPEEPPDILDTPEPSQDSIAQEREGKEPESPELEAMAQRILQSASRKSPPPQPSRPLPSKEISSVELKDKTDDSSPGPPLSELIEELGDSEIEITLIAKRTLPLPDGGWLHLGCEEVRLKLPAEKLPLIMQIEKALLDELADLVSSSVISKFFGSIESYPEIEEQGSKPGFPPGPEAEEEQGQNYRGIGEEEDAQWWE